MDQMTNDWTGHELRPMPQAMPDVQNRDTRMVCRCGARDGWAKLNNPWDDDLWVCVRCGGPSYMAEEKRMGLAFFRGGPLDGRAYEVATLADPALAGYLTQYNWTPEVVTSEATQRTARVWAHKETPGEIERQAEAAVTLPPAQPDPVTVADQEGANSMTQDQGAVATKPTVSTAGLRERREALKASRTDIEKRSGLTVPMIARIEKGGPSTKQDEADKYAAALDAIEKDGAGKEQAAPRGKAAKKTAAAAGDAKEGGDTEGSLTPPPSSAATAQESDTGGVVRLHDWNDLTFTPRGKGDMSGGSPVRWSQSPSAAFTFVAFTRNEEGKEAVELWETRRRRVRYAKPDDVASKKARRTRKAS